MNKLPPKRPSRTTKTVCVAMSGGVDSSIAAFLLQQEGWQVIGIHLRFWHDPLANPDLPQKTNKCCDAGALADTRRVADQLNIPFYVFDVSAEFYQHLVKPFLASYKRQETPNPCVRCNQFIKFGAFWQKAQKLGADFMATGHYARIQQAPDGTYSLYRGQDANKDQSYFLYRLNQAQLTRTFLPLGTYQKPAILALAKRHGLLPSHRKESQDLCFVPENNLGPLLRRHLGEKSFKPGPIVEQVTGKQLGIHQGLPSYTIGQRRGIAIGGQGQPLYVVAKKTRSNTLVVGKQAALGQKTISLIDTCFTSGQALPTGTSVQVSVRYRQPTQPATYRTKNKKAWLEFDQPLAALTPGQSAVLYDGDRVLGGGVMTLPAAG